MKLRLRKTSINSSPFLSNSDVTSPHRVVECRLMDAAPSRFFHLDSIPPASTAFSLIGSIDPIAPIRVPIRNHFDRLARPSAFPDVGADVDSIAIDCHRYRHRKNSELKSLDSSQVEPSSAANLFNLCAASTLPRPSSHGRHRPYNSGQISLSLSLSLSFFCFV